MKLVPGDHRLARRLGVVVAVIGGPVMAITLPWPQQLAPCPLRSLSGIPCPTCGMTRSLTALQGGDLGGAIQASPLAVVAVTSAAAWALASVVATLWPALRRRLELGPRERRTIRWVLVGLVVANWLWLILG